MHDTFDNYNFLKNLAMNTGKTVPINIANLKNLDRLFNKPPSKLNELSKCEWDDLIDTYDINIYMYILSYDTAPSEVKMKVLDNIGSSPSAQKYTLIPFLMKSDPETLGYMSRTVSEKFVDNLNIKELSKAIKEYEEEHKDAKTLPFSGTHIDDIIFDKLVYDKSYTAKLECEDFNMIKYYYDINAIKELLNHPERVSENVATWLANNVNLTLDEREQAFNIGVDINYINTPQKPEIIQDVYQSVIDGVEGANENYISKKCLSSLIKNGMLTESCEIDLMNRYISHEIKLTSDDISEMPKVCKSESVLEFFSTFFSSVRLVENSIANENISLDFLRKKSSEYINSDTIFSPLMYHYERLVFARETMKKTNLEAKDYKKILRDYKKVINEVDKTYISMVTDNPITPTETLNYYIKNLPPNDINSRAMAIITKAIKDNFETDKAQKIINVASVRIRAIMCQYNFQYFPGLISEPEDNKKIKETFVNLKKMLNDKRSKISEEVKDKIIGFINDYELILAEKDAYEKMSKIIDNKDYKDYTKGENEFAKTRLIDLLKNNECEPLFGMNTEFSKVRYDKVYSFASVQADNMDGYRTIEKILTNRDKYITVFKEEVKQLGKGEEFSL